ncbi:hypothetical protein ACFL0D_02760 [Thermoproteota archaeon]
MLIVRDWELSIDLTEKIRNEGDRLRLKSIKNREIKMERRDGKWLANAASIYIRNNWEELEEGVLEEKLGSFPLEEAVSGEETIRKSEKISGNIDRKIKCILYPSLLCKILNK